MQDWEVGHLGSCCNIGIFWKSYVYVLECTILLEELLLDNEGTLVSLFVCLCV